MYDAVAITALAAAAAGSDDPKEIRTRINDVTRAGAKCDSYKKCADLLRQNSGTDIDYDGVSGPLDFIGSGEPCQGKFSIVEFTDQRELQEYRQASGSYLCTIIDDTADRSIY